MVDIIYGWLIYGWYNIWFYICWRLEIFICFFSTCLILTDRTARSKFEAGYLTLAMPSADTKAFGHHVFWDPVWYLSMEHCLICGEAEFWISSCWICAQTPRLPGWLVLWPQILRVNKSTFLVRDATFQVSWGRAPVWKICGASARALRGICHQKLAKSSYSGHFCRIL